MNSQQITIHAIIDAPVERVWQAHTTPAEIMAWNFASDDWCCPSAQVDLRVGGAYAARMQARDGSMGFDLEAVFDEVATGRALEMTMTDGRRVRTTFEACQSGTKVTTVFDAESQHPIAMQREGWQAILNNFKAHVESKPIEG